MAETTRPNSPNAAEAIVDALIEDPSRCSFVPAILQCSTAKSHECLTAPQIESLGRLYGGQTNPRAQAPIYPGWAKGGAPG